MAFGMLLWGLLVSVAMAVGPTAEEEYEKEKYREACPDYRQYSMYSQ